MRALVDQLRSAFDGWERPLEGSAPPADLNWTRGIDWSTVPDDEVGERIRLLSTPAVESRLQSLWAVIGRAVGSDPVLADVHSRVSVQSLHNGVPTESSHFRAGSSSAIFINDAVADLTNDVTLTFQSWIAWKADETAQDHTWADAYPTLRRALTVQCLSVAYGSLWQPIDIVPPDADRMFAAMAVNWSLIFWLGHEFAHAVRAHADEGATFGLDGVDVSSLFTRDSPELDEIRCDLFAFLLAVRASSELGWPPDVPHAALADLTFLSLALAEHWYFVRPARSTIAFTSRWAVLRQAVREAGNAADSEASHSLTRDFFTEFRYRKEVEFASRPLLELIRSCAHTELKASQDRSEARAQLQRLDVTARLHLAPSSAVQHAYIWIANQTDGRFSADQLLDAIERFEVPEYNETFLSRDFYLGVEQFRATLMREVRELGRAEHDQVINPRGSAKFTDWHRLVAAIVDEAMVRVLYEVASDRHPLEANDTRDEDPPTAPPTRYVATSAPEGASHTAAD